MKNNLIKIITLLLVFVLAVSSLGACKKSDNNKNTSSDTAVVDSSEPSSEDNNVGVPSEEEEEPYDEPYEDYGGDYYDPGKEDDKYEDIKEPDPDTDYSYMPSATLNIYNKKPVLDDFMGFGGIYMAYPYRTDDNYGRNYTEKMAEKEIQRIINTGVSTVRTTYSIDDAWDSQNKAYNWESDRMQAIYKYCLALKKGDIDVVINHWYCNNYLFVTYPWGLNGGKIDKDSPIGIEGDCHEAVRVLDSEGNGDQPATLEKFAEFMAETVRQLQAHGCTNANIISIATEPYAYWIEEWADRITEDELQDRAAKGMAEAHNAVSSHFKKVGLRNKVSIMGPNFAGVEKAVSYYNHFKKYADPDACNFISLHDYNADNLIADSYDLWKETAEIYKGEFGSLNNFIWDEYNMDDLDYSKITNAYRGLHLALGQICMLNYGVKSSFVWTLQDQQWPNNSDTNLNGFDDGIQRHGLAPSLLRSSIVYAPYYSFSLAANALGDRGSKVYRGDDDTYEGVYAAMTENKDGELSILVVNTNIEDTAMELKFEKSLKGRTFYRHVYNPGTIVCTADAELIAPDLKITNTKNVLKDVVAPYTVVVYTTKKICK